MNMHLEYRFVSHEIKLIFLMNQKHTVRLKNHLASIENKYVFSKWNEN